MNIINDYKQLRIIESLKFAEENKKLKEENAELKEELAILKDLYSGATPQRYVKYKQKLEKIKKYANQLEVFTHIKEDLLNIIEGAEDEND